MIEGASSAARSPVARIVVASLLYFTVVFAAGFLFGAVRTLLVAPVTGDVGAVLLELPAMLALSWAACGLAIRVAGPIRSYGEAAVVGAASFLLLMAAETALGLRLFGRTFGEQLAGYGEPTGLIGLAAQLAYAAFPLFRAKSIRWRSR